MRTEAEMQSRLKWYVNKYIDFDGWYGMQCMDLAVDYVYWATGIRMWGDANDSINNDFKGLATVYKNTDNFQQEVGDIAVFTRGFFDNEWGHIGIVYDRGNLNGCTILEQNWDGMANKPASLRWDDCSKIGYFIRINYGKSNTLQRVKARVVPQKATQNVTVRKKASQKINSNWKVNKYGIKYKAETGTFIANYDIYTRYTGPVLAYKTVGKLKRGQSVVYDEVEVFDGHVWISWIAANGKRVYMPIRTNANGIDGPLWGKIK